MTPFDIDLGREMFSNRGAEEGNSSSQDEAPR